MSVNMPVHPWPPNETHRPTRVTGRLMLVALAISVLLLMLALGVPTLINPPGLPVVAQPDADKVTPVMVLNSTCSPFAALSGCVTTVSSDDPST